MKLKILAPLLPLLLMAACALPTPAEPGSSESETNRPTAPEQTAATQPDSLRDHYDALFTALSETITALQSDAYASHTALSAELERLRAELDRLRSELEEPDRPISTAPETMPETVPTSTESPPSAEQRLTYTVRNGTATVTGYASGTGDKLIIPSTLGGAPVTSIGDEAFSGCDLRTVILPATITHIGFRAFAASEELVTVTLPASVNRIDYDAFAHCPRLTIVCPIGSYAAQYAASFGLAYLPV